MTSVVEQRYELVPLDRLAPHPENPRQGDLEALADSIAANDFYGALVVQRSTGHILAGNHRYLAAKDQGLRELPVIFVDVDDDRARRILLVDNRSADLATNDPDRLAELLGDLAVTDAGLIGTGYSVDDLADLAADEVRETREVPAPPPPADPVTRLGDVWQLGRHRVVCGDANHERSWHAVLDKDERLACVWTDPPYGVAYVGKTDQALTIENDADPDKLAGLLRTSFTVALEACAPGAAWYVAAPAGPLMHTFTSVLHELELLRQSLVWIKDVFVLGHSDYHYRHETVFYGFAPATGRRGRGGEGWYGPNNADTVLEVARPKASRDHPTMKPIELVARCLSNSTRPGDLVGDPFGGSGSTLLAAHQLDRTARVIELDPRYVDVICRRYQDATGELPDRDGQAYDFTQEREA
jgi:DNA modification methylase